MAIVGKISISQLGLRARAKKSTRLSKSKRNKSKPQKVHRGKPKSLDFLIARAIIDITADEESIQAGEKNVEAEVDRLMKLSQVSESARSSRS
jgi:hypothetical protein